MTQKKTYSSHDLAAANFMATIALYKALTEKNLIDLPAFKKSLESGADVLKEQKEQDAAELLMTMFTYPPQK